MCLVLTYTHGGQQYLSSLSWVWHIGPVFSKVLHLLSTLWTGFCRSRLKPLKKTGDGQKRTISHFYSHKYDWRFDFLYRIPVIVERVSAVDGSNIFGVIEEVRAYCAICSDGHLVVTRVTLLRTQYQTNITNIDMQCSKHYCIRVCENSLAKEELLMLTVVC